MKTLAKSGTLKLWVHGEIGENGISSKHVLQALDSQPAVSRIEVSINSSGGGAGDGMAIYNILKRHPAKVFVTIDGIAASAASVIAMAGDEIVMPVGSVMMLHDPSITGADGTADRLDEIAEALRKIAASMAEIYAARTGQRMEHIRELMRAETWLTAQEAVEQGFADRLDEGIQIAARATGRPEAATASARSRQQATERAFVRFLSSFRRDELSDCQAKAYDHLAARYLKPRQSRAGSWKSVIARQNAGQFH